MTMQEQENGRELHDIKANGKERNWDMQKKGSLYYADSLKRLGKESKYVRVHQCGDDLFFKPKSDGSGMMLYRANFCKSTLCPICNVQRSRKIFGQVSRVMDYIEEREKNKYVFLTLTVKNPKGEDLKKTIDKMMYGLNQMTHRVMFKNMSKGWFRALEITHNWVADNYHPHFHMVIGVDERYFTEYENYVEHEEWKKEWQKCMHLDYEPRVYIEKVRKSRDVKLHDKMKCGNVIAEIAKYTAKNSDYMVMWKNRKYFEEKIAKGKIKIESRQQCYEMTDRVVAVLEEAMYKRRLVAFGGNFKKTHKLLDLDDPENGDLINTDRKELREDLSDVILHYHWTPGVGHYIQVSDD